MSDYSRSGKVVDIARIDNCSVKRLIRLLVTTGLAGILAGCGPKPEPAPRTPPEEPALTVGERLDIARAYLDEGRVGDAAELYRSVLDENSRSFEANLNLGLALAAMEDGRRENDRDYAVAREHFRAAKEIKGDDFRPYFYLGALDFRKKNYSRAIDNLEVAAALGPGSEAAHEMLGLSLIEYGSARRGREELERTLEINPDNARANVEVGKMLEKEGQYAAAMTHLERALDANPNLDMATYALQRVYYNLGMYEQAEEKCRQFLKHYPDDIQSLETLANIYRTQERTGEMLGVYGKLTRKEPKNTTYWSPLVQHYMDVEDYKKAKRVLESALKENPYYAYGNIRYGQVLLHYGDESLGKGDKMEALQSYGRAKLHFEKAKVDDRYVEAALRLIDQTNIRIDKASAM